MKIQIIGIIGILLIVLISGCTENTNNCSNRDKGVFCMDQGFNGAADSRGRDSSYPYDYIKCYKFDGDVVLYRDLKCVNNNLYFVGEEY